MIECQHTRDAVVVIRVVIIWHSEADEEEEVVQEEDADEARGGHVHEGVEEVAPVEECLWEAASFHVEAALVVDQGQLLCFAFLAEEEGAEI